MFLSYQGFVGGVETAPDQSQVAIVVVQEALVRKPGMERIRLCEAVFMSAGRARDDDHPGL